MKSLGAILALALAGLQLLAVAVVVFSSYFTSERTLLEHARTQLVDVGTNVIQHTKWFMSPARSAAELSTALAKNQIVRREDRDHLEGLLFQQLRSAPQFAGAYYGDEDGNFVYVKRNGLKEYVTKIINVESVDRALFIQRDEAFSDVGRHIDPDDKYDPRARPWYIEAREQGDSIWTDPYIFFTSQSPGITAATPVVDFFGKVQGVVGVDIEIQELSNFLSQLRIGKNGAAFILNRNGDVIAHPNPELLTTVGEGGTLKFPSIEEIKDPIARAAFGDRLTRDGVTLESAIQSDFEHLGERFVSLIMPFGLDDIPWTIVLYAPESDFIGTIEANRTQNTLIAFAVAVMTALLGLALAKRIHAPVRAFAVRSALISQGEVDPEEPMPSTYRELENANTALVNEISQRKKTETEYRLTFEKASRGMVHIESATGRILRANASFAKLLGYTENQLSGVAFQSLLDPDEEDVLKEFGDSIAEHAAFGFEAKAIAKDGTPVWISFNGIYFQQAGADENYIVATIDDITQARASAEKIETLNREIAHFSRQEMMGELATGLAHELNQPLTAITQNADAAQYMIGHTPDRFEEVRGLLGEIDQQAHQAADIIRALRALVRKDENVPTEFGVRELLEQSRRLVLSEARQHSVQILIAKGPEFEARAVRVQVAQVVVNLLRNSVESIAETPRARKVVTVSAHLDGDFAQVTVEDGGPGIDEGLDLFTPFETTKRDGMGLGLSISRTLVEANGGKIWHERLAGLTRFSFTIPAKGAS
ncbi:cache domain-containing protein [Tropicimonas sp. S265A]|uniref:cache domain-containing protein n=1 Tax=Tropicimonas sp. S265A TaxID=3415134 RepID=UPI003C7D5C88